MSVTVRVMTGDRPAGVLSYPREGDPVSGADWTEVATVPAHSEQDFSLGAGCDVLVTELPAPAAESATAATAHEESEAA